MFSVNSKDMTEKPFAEPTSLDVSWGKELRDFSLEESWNFIAATADSRKIFGRTCTVLTLLKVRDKGLKEPH